MRFTGKHQNPFDFNVVVLKITPFHECRYFLLFLFDFVSIYFGGGGTSFFKDFH